MSKIVADICVKVGSYEKDGKTVGRYENVGAKWEKDDGGTFVTLKRTFNPAGVPNPDNKDSIILAIFDKKPKEETKQATWKEEQ